MTTRLGLMAASLVLLSSCGVGDVGTYAVGTPPMSPSGGNEETNGGKADANASTSGQATGQGTGLAQGAGIVICHVPPGFPFGAHTLTVGASAIPAHLAHGDKRGACTQDSEETIPPSVSPLDY